LDIAQEIGLLETAVVSGEWQQAENSVRSLMDHAADNMKFVYLKTAVDKQFNRMDEAIASLRQLISAMPDFAHLYQELANLLIERGDFEEAKALLQKAVELEPEKSELWLSLASVTVTLGEREAAMQALGSARKLLPGDGTVRSTIQTMKMRTPSPCHATGRVVLVSDRPGVREAKISCALRQHGWQVLLLHKVPVPAGFIEYFDQMQPFENAWQAVRDAAAFDAAVTHVFCHMNYVTASAFVTAGLNKVVLDFYDNVDGMLSDAFLDAQSFRRRDAGSERGLAFNADGLICRNLESQYLKANSGGKKLPKRLYFPDYAWAVPLQRPQKLSDLDGELHLVTAGTVWLENETNGNDADIGFQWLAELLEGFKVHLHVYASNVPDGEFAEKMADYIAQENRSKYLHIHKPLRDHDQLLQTLSTYDAVPLIRKSLVFGGSPWQYSENKYRYSYTNKVADCVDAGLSLIVHPQNRHNYGLARRLGMLIPATPELVKKEYWEEALAQAKKHQSSHRGSQSFYTGGEQIHRLIDFYEGVADDVRPTNAYSTTSGG
jgi:tetratricopeptide (TPR) repeat protein